MSFSAISSWKVLSSDGYEVEVTGRTGTLYRGPEGEYFVDSELTAKENEIAIFADNVLEVREDGQRIATEHNVLPILRKTIAGLVALGLSVEIFPASMRQDLGQ